MIKQRWDVPKGVQIKKANDVVIIPMGRTYYLRPFEWKAILLPWVVSLHGHLTFVPAINIRGTLATVTVESNGGLKLNIFNATNAVICLPAKTAAFRIFGAAMCEVQKLPNSEEAIIGTNCLESSLQVKKTVVGNTAEEIKTFITKRFPSVFDLTRHPITQAMRALRVKPTELPMPPRKPVGGSEVVYKVDKMVRNEDIRRTLQHYEEMGYIERVPINYPMFLSPLQPFCKKKGDRSNIRIVNDFRALNGYFSTNGRSQIDVRRVIAKIPQTWRCFSVLDLKEGFFSVPIEASIKSLFGFHYSGQRWVYKRLPQGFSFSPILFADRVQHIIDGTGALNFADDVLVGGETPEEHHDRLFKVLSRFVKFGLKINPSKMKIFLPSVTYLRYTLGGGNWTLDPFLKEKFDQLGQVHSRKLLEKHIGILSFARTHIPSVELLLRPLRTLLKEAKSRAFTSSDWDKTTSLVRQV